MRALLCLAALLGGAGGLAAQSPSDGVIYVPHARIDAMGTIGGGSFIHDPSFKVQMGRRVAPGSVELHDHDTDVFYIVQGAATFVTGGHATEMKEVSPGEWRGKTIVDGTSHRLEKGDVIMIPRGVPHQYTAVDGTFLYFVVKITHP